jgi:amino acid adenylation domain-containing protein
MPKRSGQTIASRFKAIPSVRQDSAGSESLETCLPKLLENQARRTPDSIAVTYSNESLTYEELDAKANQFARLLMARGIGCEDLVGVCMERSIEMLIALLGVLKAGAAYVPLDPAYPPERIQYVLKDANIKTLVTNRVESSSISANTAEAVCLNPELTILNGLSESAPECRIYPKGLAYVIYTSGSTGKPKGVQIVHRSLVNFLFSMRREPGLSRNDVLLAVTTISFDIAGLEMFLPLLVGAHLVIAPREATVDGALLAELLKQSRATVMQATPVTWRLLFESGWHGDANLKVLVGGEALPPGLAKDLVARCGPVWNMYGPTETTIWSTIYRVTGKESGNVPIGRPIDNTSLYILDANREEVLPGTEGELFIGGDGLARGYLGRPDLTGERFLADPFSSQPGARMYLTGDLARLRPDGNVEFLGRNDQQVKIRGFRIEPGEIETVIEQYPHVTKSVVTAFEKEPGNTFLVAYVVSNGDSPMAADLRWHLAERVPDYMVPSAFVHLDDLPLTPNGKVDRKSLPAPAPADFVNASVYVAPRDAVEKKLAALWEEVLDLRPIGVTTSFFDLGGRSLLAARLFVKIRRTFGTELPLAFLFEAPTIEQLAKQLRAQADVEHSTLAPIQPAGSKIPIFCVHGGAGGTMFMFQLARRLDPNQPFYGLEPEGMDGRMMHRTTVPAIAAHYVSEIRRIQPAGPYRIGGYCFGGIVAFEMAQQLRRQGETVDMLALFSAALRYHRVCAAPSEIDAPEAASLGRLKGFMQSPHRAIGWRIKGLVNSARTAARRSATRVLLGLGRRVPAAWRTVTIAETLTGAEMTYRPQPYAGTLLLFSDPNLLAEDQYLGWKGLAEELKTFAIGDQPVNLRRDILNEPLVGLVAQQLTQCLEAADLRGSEARI